MEDLFMTGIIGLLVLIADVWAIVKIVQSAVSDGKKVLWIVLVLVFPIIGFIVWYFVSKK